MNQTQADLMGTRILYDSGYDPIAMPQFFHKLDDGSSRSAQFFYRITAVKGEITKLGTVRATRQESAEFQVARQRIHAMPQPKPKQTQPAR